MKRAILFFLSIFACNGMFGGGLFIDTNSLVFNGKYNDRTFFAGEQITMEFKYDNFAYAGKPYQYIVFKLSEFKNGEIQLPAEYFVTRIKKGIYRARVTFILNKPGTKYSIEYHVLPYFDNHPIVSNSYFLDSLNVKKVLAYFQKPENINDQVHLTNIETEIESETELDENDIILYFKDPIKIEGELKEKKALKFTWYVGAGSARSAKDIKYSYRLDPIEDWSIFSTENSASYYFLRPGDYAFQVKAQYKINNSIFESSILSYSISVKNQIFQVKDEIGLQKTNKLPDDFLRIEHYNKSKALLIGVSEYDDNKFPDLPFVKNDIKIMSSLLKNRFNFDVYVIDNSTTKTHIEQGLNKFLNEAEKNDRLIFYFSGHGTSIGEAGFLVPSNGQSNNKVNTCISYDYISKWIDKLIYEKDIKHLLIILDACQAGLGVFSKSANEMPIVEISKYKGAHMMTAGLLNQKAIAENNNSLFTKYLVKGISGNADYNNDSVITLTELLVFVQNNVSSYAKTKYGVTQTPMMGKIKGAGEMIFIINK